MKKLHLIIGKIFIGIAIIFILIFSFVLTKSPNESFSRDILGLSIPTPPVWTSFIPYLGGFLGFIFEFFSLHGLVEILIFITFLSVGIKLLNSQSD